MKNKSQKKMVIKVNPNRAKRFCQDRLNIVKTK